MLRRIRPLFVLVSLLSAAPITASADDWASPVPGVFGVGGAYGFKVLPKSFEAATGVLFALDADGHEEVVWSKALFNVPMQVFIAERGKCAKYVVTVDTYANLGHQHSLVVYDDQGAVRADYKLEELVSAEDIRDRIGSSVSSRYWAEQAAFKFESGSDREFFKITTKWGAVITVDLESGKVEKTGLTLTLAFTEEFYDPIAPGKGSLQCIVRNDTSWPIRIPVGFDPHTIELQGGPMTLAGNSDDDGESPDNAQAAVRMAHVRPHSERVVCEFPLDDLFAKGDKPNRDWKWDWPTQKSPPLSPIHKHREHGPGYYEQVPFQVRMQYGTYKLVSNRTTLKVKPSDAAK